MSSVGLKMHMHLNRYHTSGLSLVEIMVSMVIGLFLVIGATTVYVNSRKTADIDDTVARLQETARYALSVVETDTRLANFWGLAKDGSSIENKPSQTGSNIATLVNAATSKCGAYWPVDVERYIDATDNSYPVTFPSTCAPQPGSAVATADTLTVRHAAPTATTLDVTQIQICTSRTKNTVIFNGSFPCVINPTVPNSFDNPGIIEIHNLEANTYYVDQQSDSSTTIPSLRKKTLNAGQIGDVEIVSGVEDMQVQFGWDTTGVASSVATAAEYVNPSNPILAPTSAPNPPTGTGQIVAVRVWLLIRADTPDATFTDTRTYDYGARYHGNGTTNSLANTAQTSLGYKPNDNYRRILVSRTFFIRNVFGT